MASDSQMGERLELRTLIDNDAVDDEDWVSPSDSRSQDSIAPSKMQALFLCLLLAGLALHTYYSSAGESVQLQQLLSQIQRSQLLAEREGTSCVTGKDFGPDPEDPLWNDYSKVRVAALALCASTEECAAVGISVIDKKMIMCPCPVELGSYVNHTLFVIDANRLMCAPKAATSEATDMQKADSIWWRFSEALEFRYPGWWTTFTSPGPHESPAESDEHLFEAHGKGYRIFDNDYRKNRRPPKTKGRPRLGIVQTTTLAWTHKFALIMNSIMCYAAEQGYNYNVDNFEIQTDRMIAQGRMRSMLKYLPFYDWILHLSSDVWVLNRTKSIEELEVLDRGHEVVLSLRNWWSGWQSQPELQPFGMLRQLQTEAFFIKNTPYGRQFLRTYMQLQDGYFGHPAKISGGDPNGLIWDMGDLHAAVITFLYPQAVADQCNWFYHGWRNGSFTADTINNYKPNQAPYKPMHPLDFYLWTIMESECSDILRPGSIGKLAIYPEGAFIRDWGMSGLGSMNSKCTHPDPAKCQGLLQCTDFLVHTKTISVNELYTKEDTYCLPPTADSKLANMWLTEEESTVVALQVNGHSFDKTGGTYRGCGHPALVELPNVTLAY
jgi:hypothetical protein